MVLVDPPKLFWGLWKMFLPMIPMRTREKIAFAYSKPGGTPSASEVLAPIVGPHLQEYLLGTFAASTHK
eukprot:NODE_9183_length_379_cov_64.809091_g8283_i0.p2 GENE.NODE_9183_length_379_cov_64.809091_g8283_i0~~NODE_9183_length_379_cov_64.809091_g8283_i0.p2  ORF type:complete len:69 (+),score=16.87 NODE_9183_length_379_cov_64.809091_g8283_i0:70-276(+)